jgi:hypothetical protein
MLRNRISIFVSLPLSAIDTLSLQRRLDNLGRAPARAEIE